MLQYLINASAIWLISLATYELFLKKESYHSYNRFFLLFTFIVGAVFPLMQWRESGTHYLSQLEMPVERVIAVKKTIVEATSTTASINWQQWLLIVYIAGALMSAVLLLLETAKLIAYYRAGRKYSEANWSIIETGKEHAPFSLLNTLYVCDREQYNDSEWRMILIHEHRHYALLHFADLLLMQLAKIIFWFHPLVHVYNKRLLLVHEFQADKVSAQKPQQYGQFLVEQALLQSAPVLSHSFNRSPIKKRIIMLTRKSTAAARTKMLVFIPLAMVCFIFFSKNSFSQKFERKGNIVTYRGNTFEYEQEVAPDTALMTDPVTGEEVMRIIKRDPQPEKMNGEKIYRTNELSVQPKPYAQNGTIPDYVFRNISNELDKFPDCMFRLDINNIIIDKKGKIVFYEAIGISRPSNMKLMEKNDAILKRIDEILNKMPALEPGKLNDKNVIVLLDLTFLKYEIEVKNHQSTVKQLW